MKNENYGLIGIRGDAGCTAEQLEYAKEWKRCRDIYLGKLDRPWACIGFKPRHMTPACGRSCCQARSVFASRFVDPALVEVVTMTRRPVMPRRRATRISFEVLVQTPYSDERGIPSVGGSRQHLSRWFDFAISPLQDHQIFLELEDRGPLKYEGASGQFRILRNDLWIDLCVGTLPGFGRPRVIYRIDRQLEEFVELSPDNLTVSSGAVLARLTKKLRFGKAQFRAGQPMLRHIGGPIYCARKTTTRSNDDPFFRMLNRMNRAMNDLTLLPAEDRPAVVPIADWAPRVFVAVPHEIAASLTAMPGYSHTAYLKDMARQAIGSDGDFQICASYAGRLEAVEKSQQQPHLCELQIGDQIQRVPASSILLEGTSVGSNLQLGQPIADVCRRLRFSNWAEVEDMLDADADGNPVEFGNANWWLLPEILERQMIRTGDQGWSGPGTLLDIRLLPPEIIQPSWRWVFDFEPCLPYLNGNNGFIVCPPFHHRDWSIDSLCANGITYRFAGRDRLFTNPLRGLSSDHQPVAYKSASEADLTAVGS